MKKFMFLYIVSFMVLNAKAQTKFQLLSPDKTIRIDIQAIMRLKYSVFVDDKKILDESVIGMQLVDGRSLSQDLELVSSEENLKREMIIAQVPYNRKNIPDIYNELTLQFKNHFTVIFRAYDDGVAYRISTSFPDSIAVAQETAGFLFRKGGHAYAPLISKREGLDIFHTSFEETYPYKNLDSLSVKDFMFSPVLVKTSDDILVGLTESDLDDYLGMFLQGQGTDALRGAFAAYPLEEKIA